MNRRVSDRCASNLRLDRLLSGELTGHEQRELSEHLGACGVCRSRHDALLAEYRAFTAEVSPARWAELQREALRAPPSRFVPSTAVKRASVVAGAAALAATFMLVVRPVIVERSSQPSGKAFARDETRVKGAHIALDALVRRGTDVFPARADRPLHPGDALRFRVHVNVAGHAAVLSLDGAGQVTVYSEWFGVAPGYSELLPGAVELDEVIGRESLYGVLCKERIPVSTLQAAIAQSPERPRLPDGCVVERLVLRKEPR